VEKARAGGRLDDATHLNRPYAQLAPVDQENKRAAARRIPKVPGARRAGSPERRIKGKDRLVSARTGRPSPNIWSIISSGSPKRSTMAELAQGEEWVARWRTGRSRKRRPALVLHATPSEIDKRKDRNSVFVPLDTPETPRAQARRK